MGPSFLYRFVIYVLPAFPFHLVFVSSCNIDFTTFVKTYSMPSFDIVSKVDAQALDNAVNVVHKEVTNRFDFKDSPVVIDLDKKGFQIKD